MEQEDVYGSRGSSWQRATGRSRRRRRRRKNWTARLGGWTRTVIAFLFSNVGIVCLVIGYTIAGAFIFTRIEGRYSKDIAGDVKRLRNLTVTTLWKLSAKENYAEKLWMAKVRTILENYQNKMVTAIRNGYDGMEESKKWSFAGAFLYSLTVITTIGYGNICPKTKWGKIVTIVYAIIGMPLFLLYLSNIGDILAKSFKWTYARCCLCKCRRRAVYIDRGRNPIPSKEKNYWQGKEHLVINRSQWDEQFGRSRNADERKYTNDFNYDRQADRYGVTRKTGYEIEGEELEEEEEEEEDEEQSEDSESYDPQRVTVPLTLCLGIMVGYIWGGAILFSEWEDWNMLDGSYFCFVSLSTIGFGDIVPGDKIYSGQGFELSFIFCSLYLMLGMALIAMCFNLMQEEVIAKMRALLRMIKYIFRCDR